MSIIPAGKRRKQIAQGAFKNESILDNILFNKLSQGARGLIDDPAQSNPHVPNDLQQTMNSGNLGFDEIANHQEQDRNPPPEAMQDQQSNITPAGRSPADQFLGPTPVQENQQGVNPYEMEIEKIRQYIGYQNYGLKLDSSKDGILEVQIEPPPIPEDLDEYTQPVDIGQLLSGLKQITQGEWKGEETPSVITGGPVIFKYIPQSMETQKVTKR